MNQTPNEPTPTPSAGPSRYVAPGGRMDAWSAVAVRWLTAHGISLYGSRVLVVRGRTSPGSPAATRSTCSSSTASATSWPRAATPSGCATPAPRASEQLQLGKRVEAGRARRAARWRAGAGAAGLPHEVGLGGGPVRRGPVQEVHRRGDRRGRARDAGLPGPHRRLTRSWVLRWSPGQPPEHPTRENVARVGPVSDALVHRADDDRIAVLTLDSPANRNALSRRLVADLAAAPRRGRCRRVAARRAAALVAPGVLRRRRPQGGRDRRHGRVGPRHHRPPAGHRRPAGAGRLPARRARCAPAAWAWSPRPTSSSAATT